MAILFLSSQLWDLVLVCCVCVCVCVKIVCIQFLQYFRRFKMCQQNVGMSTFSDTKCGHEHFLGRKNGQWTIFSYQFCNDKILARKNYNYRTQSTWSEKYVFEHISVQNTSNYEIR